MRGYISYILRNAQRVLTQVDRDKDSLTYGSCDRNYWHLKIRDFSSAILQQAMLTLALLYKVDFEGNVYYNKPCMYEWSVAALQYLKKIQLRDGSYNEYYPYEHGYPPTAFNLFSACYTYKVLELEDEDILHCLMKTGQFLASHEEEKALNQEVAAMTGLYMLYTIRKEQWIEQAYRKKLNILLGKQSSEGWFIEQGGADIGYLSVSLDMLAEYYWLSNDPAVIEPIGKLIGFIQYFIHPNQTVGGEYGSRNTTYLMPNGFATMAIKGNPAAGAIEKYLFENMEMHSHFMNSVDERYLSHYVMHSFLRSVQKKKETRGANLEEYLLPCFKQHTQFFCESGFMTHNNGNYHAVCGLRKGGVLKVFINGEEKFADFGYRYKISDGKIAATNWLDPAYEIYSRGCTVSVEGQFNIITQKVQNPVYHLGLRLSAFVLGKKINSYIKRVILFADKHVKVTFMRNITFEEEQVVITDTICNQTGRLIELEEAGNFSLRLVASGKFYSGTDLLNIGSKTFVVKDKVTIKKIFAVGKEKALFV